MGSLSILQEVLDQKNKRKEVALATITKASGSAPRGVGTMMAVLNDRSIVGTIGGGALENYVIDLSIEALKSGKSKSFNLKLDSKDMGMICGGEVEVFIDVYKNRPNLMIIGSGHVGHALYKQALLLDFDIAVFDDREEYLNRQRFPDANELVLGDPEETLKDYHIDDSSYMVIVTRQHEYDEVALKVVVNSGAKYIGVMGSKNKTIRMMDSLKEDGISKEKLEKVYSPIGLNIASEKTEEIAASIMSEILLVKNNGNENHRKINLWE